MPAIPEEERWRWEDRGHVTLCRIWTGSARNGYGTRWRGSKKIKEGAGRRRIVSTHRDEFERANGPIPAGKMVLHDCDVKLCGNPEHLYLGDHAKNMLDAIERGQFVPTRGEERSTAKLRAVDVREIRASDERQVDLARRFGVSATTIRHIRQRKKWRSVA